MLWAIVFFSLMGLTVKFVPHIPAIQLVFIRSVVSLVIIFYFPLVTVPITD